MKLTAFIPARKGSQSIPRKNLQQCGEKTLLASAIGCGKAAKCISEVVVSSDGDEILAVATALGATALKRPTNLARNHTPMAEAVLHFLENITCEWFVILQPTSPFRTARDVDKAARLLKGTKATGVIAVSEPPYHPLKAMLITPKNQQLTAIGDPTHPFTNRQQLPPAVMPNGAIYIYNAAQFKRHKGFYLDGVVAFKMPPSIDIDTPDDLSKARELMAK